MLVIGANKRDAAADARYIRTYLVITDHLVIAPDPRYQINHLVTADNSCYQRNYRVTVPDAC